jgi:hypothetical protein
LILIYLGDNKIAIWLSGIIPELLLTLKKNIPTSPKKRKETDWLLYTLWRCSIDSGLFLSLNQLI